MHDRWSLRERYVMRKRLDTKRKKKQCRSLLRKLKILILIRSHGVVLTSLTGSRLTGLRLFEVIGPLVHSAEGIRDGSSRSGLLRLTRMHLVPCSKCNSSPGSSPIQPDQSLDMATSYQRQPGKASHHWRTRWREVRRRVLAALVAVRRGNRRWRVPVVPDWWHD